MRAALVLAVALALVGPARVAAQDGRLDDLSGACFAGWCAVDLEVVEPVRFKGGAPLLGYQGSRVCYAFDGDPRPCLELAPSAPTGGGIVPVRILTAVGRSGPWHDFIAWAVGVTAAGESERSNLVALRLHERRWRWEAP